MEKKTDFPKLLTDLDAGIYLQKAASALSDVALGVAVTGRKGRVVLTFDLERIGESAQVEMQHKITYSLPTERGKVIEENTTSTPLHVASGGVLSIIAQTGDMFAPRGEVQP